VEVTAKYSTTKRVIQREISDLTTISGTGKAVKPEKAKKLGVTERVNEKERLFQVKSREDNSANSRLGGPDVPIIQEIELQLFLIVIWP